MAALTDPSLQALVPNRRQLPDELCLSIRAILARLWKIQDAPFGGGPFPRTRLSSLERSADRLRATPRQATIPGQPSFRALIGVPNCATRARRPLPTASPGPNGSAFPLKTGALFTLGTSQQPVWEIEPIFPA